MEHNKYSNLSHTNLGKKTIYKDVYDAKLLTPIGRNLGREQLKIRQNKLPFFGYDLWNCYELSWLNPGGKPNVAIVTFYVPVHSKNIPESKSVKLYLNSLNNSTYTSSVQLSEIIKRDLTELVGEEVKIIVRELEDFSGELLNQCAHILIDNLDIQTNQYQPAPELLKVENEIVEEKLYSNLLKSNCLVTNQPDWASVYIDYRGAKIDRRSLLKYIISFRNHNEFHEQCVERIFTDIMQYCQPKYLTVHAKYTRRGGIDICPIRSSKSITINDIDNSRTARQ